MKFPRAVRRLGVVRPLLVHVRARVGQHAVIQLRVIPRHDQRRRAARAAAHRRAALGILRQLHVVLLLDQRQHFRLDELRVAARHRVVLQAALAALRVAAAVADRDGDHHRHALLRDQIVERREQQLVGAVGADDERRGRAGDVLLGHVDRDRRV